MATVDDLKTALEFVLQQQLVDENYQLVNRTNSITMRLAGLKPAYQRVRDTIMTGVSLVEADKFEGFIQFLSDTFSIPEGAFVSKLHAVLDPSLGLDTRMKFIQVTGVLREYWQDVAYERAIADVQRMVSSRTRKKIKLDRDATNAILCNDYSEDFSVLINLHVVRAWGDITHIPLDTRSVWLGTVNKLTSRVAKSACI